MSALRACKALYRSTIELGEDSLSPARVIHPKLQNG